ncbi:MAG TPA: DNA polymerase IV [Treponemataceae bacterium]|jgi:DNA polymerase-4|nr:MAG: DNA polymerase IV [Spirochaetes bacterium ADurb.Bin269]TAH52099.1 MAG: DNA polymerase IV [Treponema sp.]HOC28999.1 DNA polymerase IV [Treponemataceae bacterium]HQL32501.1 DNA polymerase IV [Treponemataceae bacterium]
MKPIFFHVDLDAFFASVEQLDNPSYRGKPVIVGGDPAKRGVVSTCSYEARKFGVHSAMPMSRAVQLCPHAIFTRGRMHRYFEKSREVMQIFSDFSPDVQQISVDEAFLDMTGTERLFGPAEQTARTLKQQVRDRTGLTVSVGVASNRYIAKIASGQSKPDGLVIVPDGGESAFMAGLPLKDVWGIGQKTRERLEGAGLATIPDLLNCSEQLLQGLLGPAGGLFLYTVLRGTDPGIFTDTGGSRSLSSERTFAEDLTDRNDIDTALLEIAEEVMYRLRQEGSSGRTVHVKIRYQDFRTVSVQESRDTRISDSLELYEAAKRLFDKKYERGLPVRLLGIAVCNIGPDIGGDQQDLFDTGMSLKKRKVEEALFALSEKRGKRIATKARLVERKQDDPE